MKRTAIFLFLFVFIHAVGYSNQPADRSRILIEIPDGTPQEATLIAIDRIREYSGADALTHVVGTPASKEERDQYDMTVVLGTPEDSPELQRGWQQHPSAKEDSWLLRSISEDPLVILASGENERGLLYAAYRLADLLKTESDISELDLFFQPKVPLRYATIGATSHSRRYYTPSRFDESLHELPRYGYNGVMIYPGAFTPLGRNSSPIQYSEEGEFFSGAQNTKRWRKWLSEIDTYQLQMMFPIPPLIPPNYSDKEIQDFYQGGPEPEGYLSNLKSHFREFVQLLRRDYPEFDQYLFNSTEGAVFGRNKRFFYHPNPERYSTEAYLANNEKIMKAYFDVLKDVFGDELDTVSFWTHAWGITSDGIEKMREVLFQYPEVLILEDDYWNNNLWPMDIPSLNYLPEGLRANIHTKNPFGMYQIVTDGEYYGGGSLPNAYPEPHIRSAQEAIDRNATMLIQRLDIHDRTPYGTLFGTTEIIPVAASKQLWEPTPSTSQIWQSWADRRFGQQAAPFVINGLKESKSILLNGLSSNGVDLLAVGSEFQPRLWFYDRTDLSRFYLFSKPGRPMVDKTYDDVITSPDYTMFQMDTHTIPIEEYLDNKDNALASIRYGLDEIEKAKPYLEPQDYQMLRRIYVNGEHVIKALKLVGKAAYAGNIMLSNYDNIEDPSALFNQSIANLEAFIKESKREDNLIPPMNRNLTRILNNYKKIGEK